MWSDKTVFSMVFFEVDQNGGREIKVASSIWLYVAITVPLTVVVLVLWLVWLNWKFRWETKEQRRSQHGWKFLSRKMERDGGKETF